MSATRGPTAAGSGTAISRRGRHGLSATLYGVCSALTLDEFALWLDLKDDYWDKQGRKSIDAVAIFGGLLTMGFLGQDALRDLLGLEQRARRDL